MIMEEVIEMTTPAGAANDDFVDATERFRPELTAHCYRLVGSFHDAQDLVQETYVRAWRGWAGYEGRASVRTWLYQIATNVCLTALRHRSRRMLPSGLGGPSGDPDTPMHPAGAEVSWLQPFPTALSDSAAADPAEIVVAAQHLRLALIASLQHLPPRQRAVLLLRDVLDFPASEVGSMLELSVPAVKSALQRARARLAEAPPRPDAVVEPSEPAAREVLARYIEAFERADARALESLLRADASLELVGSSTWFAGKRTCAPYLERHVLDRPDAYRLTPTSANGQPAALAYRWDPATARHQPFAVAVLGTDGSQLTSITVFPDPGLFAGFGDPLPPT